MPINTMIPTGKLVRAYLSATDVSSGAAITLLDSAGNTVTPGEKDRLYITDISIAAIASVTTLIELFDDQDDDNAVDAGEGLFGAPASGLGSVIDHSFVVPLATKKNPRLHVRSLATTGTVRVTVVGILSEGQ